MKKPRKDPIREDRIHNEVLVDAYGAEERAMGWYYYLENQLQFPFQARCIAANIVSPLSKGETVEVLRMAPEESCLANMLVLIRWQGRKLAVPLSQIGRDRRRSIYCRGHRRLALLGGTGLPFLTPVSNKSLVSD